MIDLQPLQGSVAVPRDRHPAAAYLARMAPGSRRTMRQALAVIAALVSNEHRNIETLDWASMRYPHTAAIRSHLAEVYAPATANKMLAALRGVLKEAWRAGQMPAEDYHRAVDLAPIRGATLPRGRALCSAELKALFAVCERAGSPAGARDAALLALLYGAGLRRSELVALDLGDYDPEGGALTIRAGKGRKQRVSYSRNGSREALRAWITARGDAAGALFCPINKRGTVAIGQRLTDQAVLYITKKRAEEAGIAAFSPHDLRRTFISDLLDRGADIATVQSLAGHSSPTTTARYDRRGEESKKKAIDLLNIPFRS